MEFCSSLSNLLHVTNHATGSFLSCIGKGVKSKYDSASHTLSDWQMDIQKEKEQNQKTGRDFEFLFFHLRSFFFFPFYLFIYLFILFIYYFLVEWIGTIPVQ